MTKPLKNQRTEHDPNTAAREKPAQPAMDKPNKADDDDDEDFGGSLDDIDYENLDYDDEEEY